MNDGIFHGIVFHDYFEAIIFIDHDNFRQKLIHELKSRCDNEFDDITFELIYWRVYVFCVSVCARIGTGRQDGADVGRGERSLGLRAVAAGCRRR